MGVKEMYKGNRQTCLEERQTSKKKKRAKGWRQEGRGKETKKEE